MGYIGTRPTAAPLTSSQLEDGLVTAAKLAADAVETAKVKDLNVTAGKLAATQNLSTKTITLPATVAGLGTGISNAQLAGSIANAKLANDSVTFNSQTVALGGSGTIATGETVPTITTSSLLAEPTTDTTLTLAGTNFVNIPKVEIIASTGAIVTASTVSFTSSTALDFTTGATLVAGTYFIRVINPDYGAVTTATALFNVSPGPAWTTVAGSLGSFSGGTSIGTINLTATDSTGMVKQSGTFPGGVSLTTGSGTSTLTGTESGSSATTTYTFTIRATDAELQTADREFSITITHGLSQGFAFL